MSKKMSISFLVLIAFLTSLLLISAADPSYAKKRVFRPKYKKYHTYKKAYKKAKKAKKVNKTIIYKLNDNDKVQSFVSSIPQSAAAAVARPIINAVVPVVQAYNPPVPVPSIIENEKPRDLSEDLADIFGGITTNVNFDVNASQKENEPVNSVQVNAGLSANKGPVYVQYTHSRAYSRATDPYFAENAGEFQGTVDNRISLGVNFEPTFAGHNAATSIASVNNGPASVTVSSNAGTPAISAGSVAVSSVN